MNDVAGLQATEHARLEIRQTLVRGLRAYAAGWRTLAPAGAALYGVLGLVVIGAGTALDRPLAGGLQPSLATGASGLAGGLLLYIVLVLFASSVFGTVLMGMVSHQQAQTAPSRASSLLGLVHTGLLLGLCFAVLLGLGSLGPVGRVFFVVAATLAGVRWAVAAPVVVFEQRRGRAALARSSQLVRGSFWRMLMLFGTAAIAADGVAVALALPLSALLEPLPEVVSQVVPFTLYGVTLPYAYLCVVDAYQQLATLNARPSALES